MPRIPQLNTQSINTNAVDLGQGPSVARAGIVNEAWAQLGNQLANIGSTLLEKRKQADTSTFINTRKNELNRLVAQKETELDAKYTGDPTGYSAEMNDFLKSYNDNQKDLAPNDDAKLMWENDFNSYSSQIGIQAQAKENKNRALYQSGLIEEDVFKNRQTLTQKPTSVLASDFLNNSLKSVNDGIGLYYDETQAKEMKRKIGSEYASTLLEGFEVSKRYGAGLRLLNGQDPDGKAILEYADPKQIQAYKQRYSVLAEQENEVSKRLFNSEVSNVTSGLLEGKDIEADYNNLVSKSSFLPPEERAVVLDNLNNAKQYNQAMKELKTLPLDKVQEKLAFEVPRGENDVFNLGSRKQMAAMYQKAARDLIQAKNTDGAGFMISNDQDVRLAASMAMDVSNPKAMASYKEMVKQKQIANKINNVKILDKNMSKQYADILSSPNTKASNQVIQSLKQGYGNDFGQVVSEMVANGHIKDNTLAISFFMPDTDTRQQYLDNIKNKGEIEDSFKRAPKELKTGLKEMFEDNEVLNLQKAIMSGSKSGNNLWIKNSLEAGLELNYKALTAKGMSPKEAKAASIASLAGNFTTANAGRSSVVVPKEFQNYKSNIEDFMDVSLEKNKLSQMDIAVPPEYVNDPKLIGKDYSEIKDRYISELSQQGVWSSNGNQNGAKLTKLNKFGELVEVKDSQGKPIERSFTEMRDSGLMVDEEIRSYEQQITALKEEAKTSYSAAGKVASLQNIVSRLKREKARKL
jgi:hypothetical protein